MENPLHTEASNPDLISDIVAPSPEGASDVSDLAHGLTNESASWRGAWAVGTPEPDPADDRQVPDPSATVT